MKIKARWAFEAAGAGLLVSLPYYVQLLYPSKIALYHHHLHQANLIFGILIALLAVILLAFAFIVYLQNRFPPLPRTIFAAAISGAVFLRGVDLVLFFLVEWQTNHYVENGGITPGVPHLADANRLFSNPFFRIAVSVMFGLFAVWRPQMSRFFIGRIRNILAATALCLLWLIPELIRLTLAPDLPATSDLSIVQAQQAHVQKRIVWILFDELSYNLVFDHSPQGTDYPNLRSLRSKSTSFSQIAPVGFLTDRIIPSLLAGKDIHDIVSNSQGMLFYVDPAQHSLQALDPDRTLFGLAHSNGWSPGIVGWYNPYCRIFRSELTACWWGPGAQARIPAEVMGASDDRSAFANAMVLIPAFLFNPGADKSEMIGPRHGNFLELMARAHHLIQDRSVHFVFLHIPVPHPPGFYDRRTHKFCECGNYLDNLALADDALAALMHDVDQTPEKDQTTVIVSSDHSWRVPLWRGLDGWTPEEEAVSKGLFDERPVFLVHLPGQTAASEVSSPTPELLEHDIVAAMLQDKLQTPQDLLALVQARSYGNEDASSARH